MIGEEELNDRYFFVIKDKAERLKTKKQLQMNQIIRNAIQINTLKLINQRAKTLDFKESFKPNSLYDNLVDDSNRHLVNQMPYLLFGLVETIFLNEKNGKQKYVYGCGILIDANIILLPAKNLVYDSSEDTEEESEEEEQVDENKEKEKKEENEKKEKDDKNNYNFFKIEFQPLNLSPEYRSYLPSSIKVIDHYTPMNQNDNIYNSSTSSLKDKDIKTDSNKKEEETVKTESEKDGNAWGIAFLEYPVGDIINYIYKKTKISPTYSNKYSINRKNKNFNSEENNSIFDKIKIDNLSDEELTKTEFFFLECLVRQTDDITEEEENETNANTNNIEQNNIIENNENKDNSQAPVGDENKKEDNKSKEEKKENKKEEEKNDNKNENNNDINNNEENGENTEETSGFSEQQNPILPYQFFESQYLMNFEQKYIYLKNPFQDQELGKDLLPGFIVGKYINRYHILGMNTSTILAIKNTEEDNNENNGEKNNDNKKENNENDNKEINNKKEEEKKNNCKENENKDNNNKEENNNEKNNENNNGENNNENNEENNLNDSQFIHRAIRFNKELSFIINSKVKELNIQNQREFAFNERIFELLDKYIKNKEFLIY